MPVSPATDPPFSPRFVLAALALATIGVLMLIRELNSPGAALPVAPAKVNRPGEGLHPQAAGSVPVHSLTPRWEEVEPRPPPRTGTDAATFYRRAFVLFDQLSEEEKTMLRKPGDEVDEEKAAALFEKIRAIMELLRDAARAGYCDWGISPITFDTPMPHLGKVQDLGKLALWAAAWQFPSDPAAALDDLKVRAQLGHHVGDTLIGVLVESALEASATRLLLQNAARFDAAAMGSALELIGNSTIDQDLTAAFASEIGTVQALSERLASESADERLKTMGMIGQATDVRGVDRALRDPAKLAAELAFLREFQGNMAAALRLPEAQFQSWWQGVQRELEGDHPLARLLIPALDGVQRKVQQLRVERTLLSAGLDVLQHGAAQLPRYRDPATGNALIYFPTPGGFELRSTYQVKGKPVSLSFAQPR